MAPVVVGAGELAAGPRALGHHHAAVLAHGREDSQLALPVPREDERLVDDADRAEVAGLGPLVGTAHAEPVIAADRLPLELPDLGRRVEDRKSTRLNSSH